MLSSELDSFVLKFKSLWYSGIDAHLDVETHAGQAWVGLRVGLGHPPGLPQPHLLRKKDSPSKQRRRARRAEARKLAADEAAVKASENVETPKEATKDNLVRVTEEVNDIKAVEETAETMCTGEVTDEFCRNAEYISEANSLKENYKLKFAFNSEYAEQDIYEAIEEIFPDKTAMKSASLLLRVRRLGRTAVHDCVLELDVTDPNNFVWPELKGVDIDVFKEIQKISK